MLCNQVGLSVILSICMQPYTKSVKILPEVLFWPILARGEFISKVNRVLIDLHCHLDVTVAQEGHSV